MKKHISIVGGGSAALMLAGELDPLKYTVAIYERNAALGRKFLVAGDGGLNLTHSEEEKKFVTRYSPPDFLALHFNKFSNRTFMTWLNEKGIETYVGSSGRVFPRKGMKPVDVLHVLLEDLKNKNVQIHTKHEWHGFSEKATLLFKHNNQLQEIKSDVVVFCLGGATWPVTGSKGDWPGYFKKKHIQVIAFEPSNCAFKVNWPKELIAHIEGKALKNCMFSCGSKQQSGEAVLTAFGIEGSGVYPLSPELREQLNKSGIAKLYVDLKPGISENELTLKLNKKAVKKAYTQTLLTQLNLNRVQIALLKNTTSKEEFLDPGTLVKRIKQLPISISGCDAIEHAISSVGGIDLQEISRNYELKKMPGMFVIGEMLDFDAPTGGYLLQACFTMALSLARHLNQN